MINLDNVSKKFGTGVFGLSGVSFAIEKGEFVFLVGPTGSGKTTIFRLLIRETMPTQGTIVVNSWDLVKLPSKKIPELRKKIGVVFQDLKLLPDRTIMENIILPLEISGVNSKEAKKRAEEILEQIGIIDHRDKFPRQLSGGEEQRVAIARAVVLSPEILLADEPTGNLDDTTSWEIVKLLSDINERGTTVIMATHNTEIIKKLNKRVIHLDKGMVVNDKDKHRTKEKSEPEPEADKKEKKEVKEEKEDEKVENFKKEEKEKEPSEAKSGSAREKQLDKDDLIEALKEVKED